MAIQTVEPITKEQFHQYIAQAAKTAGYEKGFGVQGCDLSQSVWWASYARQSLDQQVNNNRLPEYLLTLARMARDQGIVVPIEYIFYDHETGEHLERPGMSFMRYELAHKKRILGIMFADLRCLSREPAPQQVFERECEILGIRLLFGDAPSGTDIGSQFARSAITFSNKLARLATHKNARAGNIGRILKGSVPACKAAYGYRYRRDAEITSDGKVHIKKAWWEVDEVDAEGVPIANTPAWVVTNIFKWIGVEGRTSFWVAKKLNDIKLRAPAGGIWAPNRVCKVVHRRCYTGKNVYNSGWMVPNPNRPLGDVTAQVKRTILRLKPEEEWVHFSVPPLISGELWQQANEALTKRGRGRGKQGKSIQALLRNRIICPRCGKPMVVRRDGYKNRVYYHCSKHYRPWDNETCTYRRFVPGTWDETVWDFVCALLSDNAWIDEQITVEQSRQASAARLLDTEQRKIIQIQSRIAKIQEGFEAGIYSVDEAKKRIGVCQNAITHAEQELERLRQLSNARVNAFDTDSLRTELKALGEMNLNEASFEERRDVVSKLDIKVYPSEDLKTIRIKCRLNLNGENDVADNCVAQCRKIIFGPP